MTTKEAMIKKLGSEEAYKAYLRELAKRPRPNSKGGAFRDREFARRMGKMKKSTTK
jgi:hypothetical protein